MIRRTVVITAICASLAACNTGSKGSAQDTGYAGDGDTGAPAPATQPQVTPSQPPDSTTGVSAPTGRPGSAGAPNARKGTVSP